MKKEESYALKCMHHSHLKIRSGTKSMNRKNHNLVEWTHSEKAVGRMKKKTKMSVHTLYIREPLDPGSLYFTENKVGQSSFLPQVSGFVYKVINYKSFLHP